MSRWPVTGVGAVTSIGSDPDELFAALCAGRSGLGRLRGFNRSWYNADRLYEVDNRPAPGMDVTGRATALLLDAVGQALRDAGREEDLSALPVLIGTGLRELRSLELWWRDGQSFDSAGMHFGTALRRRFGADDTHTISNACSASLYALALGTDLLELGDADTVVVAGVDVITESMFGLSDRLQLDPPDRLRPFDRERKGTVMGEGAAAVVLQREATGRDARGFVRGVAVNCDAYHATAPDPEGIARAVTDAHHRAGVKPQDVDLVMVHGTGTPLNDAAEATALAEVFGEHVGSPLMTGIKSMTGHTSGASGLLSLIVALHAMREGRVPPLTGLGEAALETDGFRLVRDETAASEVTLAQIDAFGFGGINAVALVEAAR
ncbi:beta-ketoacyl-[acyl-carrier-protein] synthase II [Streptomyces capoamus]|uniref:Beta-ketoacyl-[acyl-carrier-protein] synthase II n=1 Tax=Streptomyces capoamus TaxID=68183 RepID=A0A919F2Z5_9ACTN|nr:beta-ketoacyl synthase N-terminal-like domain-containing protein [Streptomyces capoamus]GGW13170.1 beta-ketoacyl-[acyl-carrier-protein] synthase II [Streptomyces libani subsp. rufus]GHG74591.1 beta-ketoacyl-[acyl-carrier-protein] synthase II [Streptomyces capoamus]